jgi:hypothetical protein
MLFILIILIGGLMSYFLPWWIIAPVVLVLCGWKSQTPKGGFAIGAAATVALWLGYATILHLTADVNLTDKMADLFTGGVGFMSKIPKVGLVFSIMTTLATLVGGFSGMAGVQIRNFIKA